MMYIALIGDIIKSKKIQDRAQAQQQLLQLMKELNQQYQKYLISPLRSQLAMNFKLCFYQIRICFKSWSNFLCHLLLMKFDLGLVLEI